MKAMNITDDGAYDFWELCVKEGWTDKSYDDFDNLSVFEGDPDMIRIEGQLGVFFYHEETDTVWYWFDDWGCSYNVGSILIDFFEKRLGNERWNDNVQSWDWFEKHNGIAYRGGMGYVYGIYPLRIAA